MKWTRLAVLLPLAAMALLVTLGCGNGDTDKDKDKDKGDGGKPKVTPPPTPPATAPAEGVQTPAPAAGTVDQTDANAVAMAFVKALAAKDEAKTLPLIHPDQREELKAKIAKDGYPPVPENPQVTVKVTGEGDARTGKFEGNVRSIRNLGMKFDKGKWWVVD